MKLYLIGNYLPLAEGTDSRLNDNRSPHVRFRFIKIIFIHEKI